MPVSASDVIFKIITLFLVFIAVLGMFGKLHVLRRGALTAPRCKECGRFTFGKRCDCKGRS